LEGIINYNAALGLVAEDAVTSELFSSHEQGKVQGKLGRVSITKAEFALELST
jgi:hypothetical protein